LIKVHFSDFRSRHSHTDCCYLSW